MAILVDMHIVFRHVY